MLTRSRLGLLSGIFPKFVTVMAHDWCQSFVSAQYLDRIQSNSVCALILIRCRLELVYTLCIIFHKFGAELWPLIDVCSIS